MSLRPSLAVLAALALLAGCGDSVQTFDNPGGALKVEAGDQFRIELGENPSTGYRWRFRRRPNPRIVRYLGSDFELEEGGEERAGAGGTRTLRFRAVYPGRATMVLENVFTGGEPGRRPADVRHIVVAVLE